MTTDPAASLQVETSFVVDENDATATTQKKKTTNINDPSVLAWIHDAAVSDGITPQNAFGSFLTNNNNNPRKNLAATFENVCPTTQTKKHKTSKPPPSATVAYTAIPASLARPPTTKNTISTTTATSNNATATTIPKKTNLKVFLRIRPLQKDAAENHRSTLKVLPQLPHATTVQTVPPPSTTLAKQFGFTRVLSPSTTQPAVYDIVAAPMIQNVLSASQSSSTSALLFSYGITNAGKTHTILGSISPKTKSEQWGIIPRALEQVLQHQKQQSSSQSQTKVYLSFFEIYHEHIHDLLPHPSQTNTFGLPESLKVGGGGSGDGIVKGLAQHKIETMQQGLDYILQAHQRRRTSSNNLNQDSSRSHCICQIQLQSQDNNDSSTKTIWIVDLAGSERSKRTQLIGHLRQKEASMINQSLMTLMRCLTAMRENQNSSSVKRMMIPFRESKLTHIFMGHLTGPNAIENTTMIVNVHPSVPDFEETQHVLGYASQAQQIMDTSTTSIGSGIGKTTTRIEYDDNGHRIVPVPLVRSASASTAAVSSSLRQSKPLVRSSSTQSLQRRTVAAVSRSRPALPVAKLVKTASSGSLASMKPPPATTIGVVPTSSNNKSKKKKGIFAKVVQGLKHLSPMKAKKTNGEKRKLPPLDHPQEHPPPPSWKRSRPAASWKKEEPAAPSNAVVVELMATKEHAKVDIQRLRREKDDLLEELGLQEELIRMEVADEMERRLCVARERSQQEIARLRSLLQETQQQQQHARRGGQQVEQHMDQALEALMDKVDACEEEMQRMRQDHQSEVSEWKSKLEEALHQSKQQAQAWEASQQQVQRLKTSKAQLQSHYEDLLLKATSTQDSSQEDEDDDEEEEKDEEEDNEDDDEEEENQPPPLWKQKLTRNKAKTSFRMTTRGQQRRVLGQVQKVAVTSDK